MCKLVSVVETVEVNVRKTSFRQLTLESHQVEHNLSAGKPIAVFLYSHFPFRRIKPGGISEWPKRNAAAWNMCEIPGCTSGW